VGIGRATVDGLLPVGRKVAPKLSSGYVRGVLEYAIDGLGPIRPAAAAADDQLALAGGDVEASISALTNQHIRYAAAQGFVTNLGGVATMAVSVPANVTGVAVVQCHLAAGIVHLRGYDLTDPRVRNAIVACLLGEDAVREMIKQGRLPGTPMLLATSPVHDPVLDNRVASAVTTELFGKVTGRRAALLVSRKIPLLGGGVGAATDSWSTYEIGRYVAEQMRDRRHTGSS